MSKDGVAGDVEPPSQELRAAIDAWRRAARGSSSSRCPWEHRVWNRSSVRRLLARDPALSDGFERLAQWPERQKDFFMYVVLGTIGGVFADADVVPLRPPADWLGEAAAQAGGGGSADATGARLLVGLEAAGSDEEARNFRWAAKTQLCAWTVAGARGHPIFLRAVDRYLRAALPAAGARPNAQYEFSIAFGPGLFTTAVAEWLRERRGAQLGELASVRGRAGATLAGDTVVLGIGGFGCGQVHSGSRPCNETAGALVQHLFSGAWKGGGPSHASRSDFFGGRRRRRRTGEDILWYLPALALMADVQARTGFTLTWEVLRLFFSRIVPIEPPLLPAPPARPA